MTQPITFITGVYGSGKTCHALELVRDSCERARDLAMSAETGEERSAARAAARRYVDFDARHDYSAPRPAAELLAELRPGDVIDAIPFDGDGGWDAFLAWARGRVDVQVVVAFCRYGEWSTGSRRDYAQWCRFWVSAFGRLPPELIEWWDTGRMRGPASRESAAARVNLEETLRAYIEEHPHAGHDAKYQDIPEIEFPGYSESARSWETIHGLVGGGDWSGKTVVDCGCNHGFFSFRAREAGAAKVIGLDRAEVCLAVARCVAQLGRHDVEFRHWDAGLGSPPAADVTLCLNALHHFTEAEREHFVERAAGVGIYEVGVEFRPLLEKHYSKVEEYPSHRSGRAIYRCERTAL